MSINDDGDKFCLILIFSDHRENEAHKGSHKDNISNSDEIL